MTQIQPKKPSQKFRPDTQTFLEHLLELKNKLSIWLFSLIFASALGYCLYPSFLAILVKPLGKPLYYTSPGGGFEVVLNTSLLFGFIVTIPVLLYQSISFILPSFDNIGRRTLLKLTIASLLLAVIGLTVCYYLILPSSLRFLGEFGGNQLSPLISSKDYLSFVSKYLTSFSIFFQMPLVMAMINKFHPLNASKLVSNFRYVVLLAFIVSAILTPTPDLINQSIMAAPILILYIVSVLIVWISSFAGKTVAHTF